MSDFSKPRRSRYRFPPVKPKTSVCPLSAACRAALIRITGAGGAQDYSEACAIGRQYAAHLAQLLKTNRQHAARGLLFRITSDMDFADKSHRIGLCKGFFNYLEMLLNLAVERVDLAQHVEAVQQLYLCLEQIAQAQTQKRYRKRSRGG